MHPRERATLDVPRELQREIARFGGLNPFGGPMWRVVRAENVLEQRFGQMRQMPRLKADEVGAVPEVEPEGWASGEMWLPRYDGQGYCLERWFSAGAWGSEWEWAQAMSQDGVTRMTGEFPRHGDYQMVNGGFISQLPGAEFWKAEMLKWTRGMERLEGDEAARLKRTLYLAKLREEEREREYAEEVNRIHRTVVDPALATIGRTAQRMRDELAAGMGWNSHLPAG